MTVAYRYIDRVEVTSVGLAHARPIMHIYARARTAAVGCNVSKPKYTILAKSSKLSRRMQRIVGERERGTVHGGCIRLLPPEINWAHRLVAVLSF